MLAIAGYIIANIGGWMAANSITEKANQTVGAIGVGLVYLGGSLFGIGLVELFGG